MNKPKILICEDIGYHNTKYYDPIEILLKDQFNFSRVLVHNNLKSEFYNNFDLVLTSNAIFSRITDLENLKTPILSWNHSMLGPCQFNNYHYEKKKLLSEKIDTSVITCLYPSYYKDIEGHEFDKDGIYTNFYYRLLYIKQHQSSEDVVHNKGYINHWSTSIKLLENIISNMDYTLLHPSYYLIDKESDNPLNLYLDNPFGGEYFRELVSKIKTLVSKSNNEIEYKDIFSMYSACESLFIDSRTGSLPELLIKSLRTKVEKPITIINHKSASILHQDDNSRIVDFYSDIKSRKDVYKSMEIHESFEYNDGEFEDLFKKDLLNTFNLAIGKTK